LVDGDSYEPKNESRQEFVGYGNKARLKCVELQQRFKNLNFQDYPFFLDEAVAPEIIKERSIVFVAVDNHKTRKLISDYAKKLNDILIISGGNELTDGNVQIYFRKEGNDITPSLTDYHPEIDNPEDKSPDEMSCEELSKSQPQLFFTNLMVAGHMCSAFYNLIERNDPKISEVYFDLITMNAHSKTRVPKKKN
jgi:molybdopterin/thiamine biosynthesis adenylyltransferase